MRKFLKIIADNKPSPKLKSTQQLLKASGTTSVKITRYFAKLERVPLERFIRLSVEKPIASWPSSTFRSFLNTNIALFRSSEKYKS